MLVLNVNQTYSSSSVEGVSKLDPLYQRPRLCKSLHTLWRGAAWAGAILDPFGGVWGEGRQLGHQETSVCKLLITWLQTFKCDLQKPEETFLFRINGSRGNVCATGVYKSFLMSRLISFEVAWKRAKRERICLFKHHIKVWFELTVHFVICF